MNTYSIISYIILQHKNYEIYIRVHWCFDIRVSCFTAGSCAHKGCFILFGICRFTNLKWVRDHMVRAIFVTLIDEQLERYFQEFWTRFIDWTFFTLLVLRLDINAINYILYNTCYIKNNLHCYFYGKYGTFYCFHIIE